MAKISSASAWYAVCQEREGVTREGEPRRLYSIFADVADRDAFIERGLGDRHQFQFILSP